MKKRGLIYAGIVLLVCLLVVLSPLTREEKPEYFTPEIPMPQHFATYEGHYAAYEEFSTLVDNAVGDHPLIRYFVYRMYIPVEIGREGFESREAIEIYYDKWMKKLGWKEAGFELCDSREETRVVLRRAYVYPTEYYRKPYACFAMWFEYDNNWTVLIKTVNPSRGLRDAD